jgi:hypothetical protein
MSRLHFAESIILFAPGLHSRPGNLAKSPATQIGFSSEDCPRCFALSSECYQQVNAIIPRERHWERGVVLFTQ